MEETDTDLATRARKGDVPAYTELIRRHERSLLALAYACTRGDAATAADVVQDAFLRCWQRIADLREPSRFVPWVATTVRNLSANALRGPARRMKLTEPQMLDVHSRGGDEAADPVEAADDAARIARAISQLDETSAAVVTLRYYDDLPSKQIAELLDLTPAAVDMRLSRARTQLKELLKDYQPREAKATG